MWNGRRWCWHIVQASMPDTATRSPVDWLYGKHVQDSCLAGFRNSSQNAAARRGVSRSSALSGSWPRAFSSCPVQILDGVGVDTRIRRHGR
jgi:hypothetical protein